MAHIWTAGIAVARGLLWVRPHAAREVREWRERASAIPDRPTREDALHAIARKRDNVDGAALFSILPARRSRQLLRLLVAYQVMWDFLDSVSERGAGAGAGWENGRQLHRALVDALDPGGPVSDFYRYHPWQDDGGYLRALVHACRQACAELPSYELVRPLVLQGVRRCAIQYLNHEPSPERRDGGLREHLRDTRDRVPGLSWFELAAAHGAYMPHPLLALAAERSCTPDRAQAVQDAYFPWVSLAISMFDSYVDRFDDALGGQHSYLAHYPSPARALERLGEIVERLPSGLEGLPRSARHAVLVEGIVAMYLSCDHARDPALRAHTGALLARGGKLSRLLVPVARGWRSLRDARLGGREATPRRGLPPGPRLPRGVLTYLYWQWPLQYMEHCRERYGRRCTQRMVDFPTLVFLSDPADIRAVVSAPAEVLHPGEGGAKVRPIVGERSFMLLDEDEHRLGRRAVSLAFSRRAIEREGEPERMAEIVRRAVQAWPERVPVSLHPRLRALTLEVVLRRIFCACCDSTCERRLDALHQRVLAMLDITASVTFPVAPLRRGPGRAVWRRFERDRARADELIHELIAERRGRELPRERGDDVYATRDGGACAQAPADALGMLLEARRPDGTAMGEAELRDNVMSLILAGHETTASQLAWAFQLLAHNPRAQRRLIEEIDVGVGEGYLTATIQEVLRHRPVFLFSIPRAVKQPIEIGGWTYCPPAHLLGCIYLLHHDPAIYTRPEEFRPERFMEGQPSPYAWAPWGGGSRRCPGAQLAMLEMKTVLRVVLERMTIAPASPRIERPRWRSVIVTPHAGSRVILHRREPRRIIARRHASEWAYDKGPSSTHQAKRTTIESNRDFSQNL